jgi:peptidoglycan hydrolase CwlO-like protein
VERLSVAKAAKVLGVSEQAIYARVKRDTIRHEKGENGEINVLLDPNVSDNHTDAQPLDNALVNDYITSLKSEIETLKSHTKSLEHDREEWKEEARRKDHIIMALTNRIPELEAPPEATESPVKLSETQDRGEVPPDAQNRSWWRRIFAD